MPKKKWRSLSVRKLERYLLEKQSPRFHMSVVLAVTGLIGFVASAWMLSAGMTAMWLRYPVAVVVAYGLFLLMVYGVVAYYRSSSRVDLADLVPEPPAHVRDSPPDVSLDDVDLGLDAIDGDEGCLVVAVVVLLLGLVLIAAYNVATAPILLAELLLDSLLIGGLYRRLKRSGDSLFLAAFLRTWGSALLAIMFLALVGLGFQSYAPDAVSIGAVIETWRESW